LVLNGCNQHYVSNCKYHYYAPPTDATVSLQMPADTTEGDTVEICADLSDIPVEGLECDVVVELSTTNGTKAS